MCYFLFDFINYSCRGDLYIQSTLNYYAIPNPSLVPFPPSFPVPRNIQDSGFFIILGVSKTKKLLPSQRTGSAIVESHKQIQFSGCQKIAPCLFLQRLFVYYCMIISAMIKGMYIKLNCRRYNYDSSNHTRWWNCVEDFR